MEYYVIRIYRRSMTPATEAVGIVELVGTDQHVRFHGFSELVDILRAPLPTTRHRARRREVVPKRRGG
jgi:hypothetical protein